MADTLPTVTVKLGDVTYVVNELTGNQDTEIAKIISDDELESLFELIKSGQLGVSTDGVATIAPLLKTLRKMLADNKLIKLLSIILVPANDLRTTAEYRATLEQHVGDLPNSKIWEILADFFAKNSPSGMSSSAELQAE